MVRRNCCDIIVKMMVHIPSDQEEFIKDLQWNYDDASYKPIEETLQWERTSKTLQKHIPSPNEEWEYLVLSEFTTMSVDEIKEMINNSIS